MNEDNGIITLYNDYLKHTGTLRPDAAAVLVLTHVIARVLDELVASNEQGERMIRGNLTPATPEQVIDKLYNAKWSLHNNDNVTVGLHYEDGKQIG